jgi:hypothetical protein
MNARSATSAMTFESRVDVILKTQNVEFYYGRQKGKSIKKERGVRDWHG